MSPTKCLYRSTDRHFIAGVATGLARYFSIDPLFVRLAFIVGLFFGGATFLAYLFLWVLIPRDPDSEISRRRPRILGVLAKAIAVVLAVTIVSHEFGSEAGIFGFVLGLCIGLYFYWRSRQDDEIELDDALPSHRRFFRSTEDSKIFGVFGGIGEALNVDSTVVRVIGGMLLIVGFPVTVTLYLIAAMVMPRRSEPVSLH